MSSGTIVSPFSPSDLQDTFLPSRRTMAIESQLFSLPLPLSVLLRSNQVYPLSTSITTAITTPSTSSSSRIPSPSRSRTLTCFHFFHFFPPLSDSICSKLTHTHIFLKKRLKDDWIPSFPIASAYPTRLLYRVGTFKQPVFHKNLPSLVSIIQEEFLSSFCPFHLGLQHWLLLACLPPEFSLLPSSLLTHGATPHSDLESASPASSLSARHAFPTLYLKTRFATVPST